jgi:hypothetical protein
LYRAEGRKGILAQQKCDDIEIKWVTVAGLMTARSRKRHQLRRNQIINTESRMHSRNAVRL